MTTFVLYIATSLDGYIARPDGSIDWLPAPEVEADEDSYSQFYSTVDALVMGATTYEQILGFGEWVYPGKRCYVLSRQPRTSDRPEICFVRGGVDEVMERVAQEGFQRVWVVGGGAIASLLIRRNLIDEYIITVIPILLGAGIPLYQSIPEQKLRLIGVRSCASGMVELQYQNSP